MPTIDVQSLVRDSAAPAGGYFSSDRSRVGETQSGIQLSVLDSPSDDSISLRAYNPRTNFMVGQSVTMSMMLTREPYQLLGRIWHDLIQRAEAPCAMEYTASDGRRYPIPAIAQSIASDFAAAVRAEKPRRTVRKTIWQHLRERDEFQAA
jgi:hypothetical protein